MFPTVYVVDDDDQFRDSLCMLIRSVGYHTEGCRDVSSFRDAYKPDHAGCIVLDVRLPRIGGLDLLKELADSDDLVPVIMISGHADVPTATQALLRGALDFLEKPFSDQRLLDRVNEAVRTCEARRDVRQRLAEARAKLARLSDREREVLDHLVTGASSPQIAEQLGLSRRTVEMHRARLARKLDTDNLAQLIRLVMSAQQGEQDHPR